jgi:hypothetical protein
VANDTAGEQVDHEIWLTVSDGRLSAEFPSLRLIVRKSDAYARYVILKRAGHGGSCAEVMLSSGTEPNVEAAIVAATKVAARIDLMLAGRRRPVLHL